ncbi:hypothetical protein [Cellulomonas sp. B6]|uniref:hypothetical protein n=1 Tax=Cellulomonas sp. B6 TaxID=1295626 RepID=UPI00073B9BD8|nr:hypothetical protein [Cellulomonas sp. B6]KSW29759.1 hypothetical protein ATM99_06410 [Cellulomonas sp. B6]
MTASLRRATGSLTLAAALTLGLAACSSPASDDTGADASPTPAATSAASEPTPTKAAEEPASDDLAEQQAKLESMVAQSQSSIPALYDAFPGMYSNIAITSEGPSTLVYSYQYSEEAVAGATVDQMREGLESVASMLQTGCESQVFPVMTAGGVTVDQKVKYTYATPSGETVWEYVCEPAA